jgi:hypothetical protein
VTAYVDISIEGLEKPGMVMHVCNPSYLGGRDQEDHVLRPAVGKSYQGSMSTDVVHICNFSYLEDIDRIVVQAGWSKMYKTQSEK